MAFGTEDGHPWHAVLEEKAFEAHDIPSVHAPQGPGSYPGPFSVVNATMAAFADQDPGQLTAPLELAQDGGARVSSRGYVARIGTALGLTFVSATDGVGRGRGQRSQPLALFHRVHGQRGKDMGRPGAPGPVQGPGMQANSAPTAPMSGWNKGNAVCEKTDGPPSRGLGTTGRPPVEEE